MREKLLLYIILFFGAMIAVLWIFQSVLLDDFYRAEKKRDVLSACNALISDPSLLEENRDRSKTIAEKYGVCMAAYEMRSDGSAKTILDTHTLSRCTIHYTTFNSKYTLYRVALSSNNELLQYFYFDPETNSYGSISEESASGNTEISMVYARVFKRESGDGDILLILDTIITPVTATIRTVRVQLGVFTALFTVSALAFALLLSRSFTAPIERLTASARAFGRSGASFCGDGYREIKELSDTLGFASYELEKTETLRRELIANVSHDLRTPLTMLIGYGEMMRDIPGENTPENANNIVREAERLNTLVTDMLELSRIRSGTSQLRSECFSLTEKLTQTIYGYSELLSREGFSINLTSDRDVNVKSDPTMIGQVVQNLLLNAIQHTGDDKRVEVSQIVSDGWVTVAITDTGAGLAPEMLPQIWERYYKINSAHRRGSGSGLGLSIVKAIMEQAGGHYGVESTVGKGSTFWFALPVSDARD